MKLPLVSGKELIKILTNKGFIIVGRKGSHIRLKKRTDERVFVTIVPLHKTIDKGTLKAILNQTGLEKEDLS
jgi:predicted RNA binding protein YcfA (HicA-like mRNA interferase family)